MSEWRSIETAPAERVLLWFPELGYPVTGEPEAYGYRTGGWRPTHWMPLPSPPSAVCSSGAAVNSIDWERDKPYESPEDAARRHEARGYCKGYFTMCSDCPPEGYPTDKTRCTECPRRASTVTGEPRDA